MKYFLFTYEHASCLRAGLGPPSTLSSVVNELPQEALTIHSAAAISRVGDPPASRVPAHRAKSQQRTPSKIAALVEKVMQPTYVPSRAGCATAGARSGPRCPSRTIGSLPAPAAAPVQTLERTSPHEGHRTGSAHDRMAYPSPNYRGMNMRPFAELTHFAGFDWATDHHDLILVDKQGTIVEQFRFNDTSEGWQVAFSKLAAFPVVGIAIETPTGPFVDRLLDTGFTIFPIVARAAKQYRLRKAPSGVKDDKLDAWSLADALRVDGHAWRPLKPEDPLTLELRLLCRDESDLIMQRTQLVNQLIAALRDYYPAALEAFDEWTIPSRWAFLLQFPTPDELHAAGKRKWEKFLHLHKLARPETYEKRLVIFSRAHIFKGSAPTTAAKSRLAKTLAKMLSALESQLDEYRIRIQKLYDDHPDRPWFGSLPISQDGKTAPRLLAELGSDRTRFDDAQGLQCVAGTAPVRFQSGQVQKCYLRRACNKHLRFAIHWFCDLSRTKCSWAAIYYSQKRAQGKSHACALRCLGQRWLKIIWKMWQTCSAYDPELHQQNQIRHGSWLFQLQSSTPKITR